MRGHKLRRACASLALVALIFTQHTLAQQQASARATQTTAKKFELTVDSIMRGPDLVGYSPAGVYWSQDSRRIFFRWQRAAEARWKEMSLYVVNRDGTGLRKLTEEEEKQAPPAFGELSKDKTLTVFTEDGDVFLYDHSKGERRQ